MKLSEKIRQARHDSGMSQRELAEAIGVTKRSISYWETTDRHPDFALLTKIARATGKSLDFFADEIVV